MGFSETDKTTVKRKSSFTCCWCLDRNNKVDIHHIKPQADGGSDDIDNAAPLCGSCHDLYGSNPDLQKEIRLRRDHWYEQCEKSSGSTIVMPETEPAGPSLHSELVSCIRLYSIARSLVREPFTKEQSIEEAMQDVDEPLCRELDDAAKLFKLHGKLSDVVSITKSDHMIPFRRAYRMMSQEMSLPPVLRNPGIVGHDDSPMQFTSYHDVGLALCQSFNRVLNQPWTIKRFSTSPSVVEDEWSSRNIVSQMEIEVTFIEEFKMYYLVPLDSK